MMSTTVAALVVSIVSLTFSLASGIAQWIRASRHERRLDAAERRAEAAEARDVDAEKRSAEAHALASVKRQEELGQRAVQRRADELVACAREKVAAGEPPLTSQVEVAIELDDEFDRAAASVLEADARGYFAGNSFVVFVKRDPSYMPEIEVTESSIGRRRRRRA